MSFLCKLGQNIKRIRESNDITQAKLAESADTSVSTIARLEIGKSFATYKTMVKIADALNVDMEELFNFSHVSPNDDLNQENFIKEIEQLTKSLKSKEDYNFILEVVKAYTKK